jgi:hypothetical protein
MNLASVRIYQQGKGLRRGPPLFRPSETLGVGFYVINRPVVGPALTRPHWGQRKFYIRRTRWRRNRVLLLWKIWTWRLELLCCTIHRLVTFRLEKKNTCNINSFLAPTDVSLRLETTPRLCAGEIVLDLSGAIWQILVLPPLRVKLFVACQCGEMVIYCQHMKLHILHSVRSNSIITIQTNKYIPFC